MFDDLELLGKPFTVQFDDCHFLRIIIFIQSFTCPLLLHMFFLYWLAPAKLRTLNTGLATFYRILHFWMGCRWLESLEGIICHLKRLVDIHIRNFLDLPHQQCPPSPQIGFLRMIFFNKLLKFFNHFLAVTLFHYYCFFFLGWLLWTLP